MLSYCRVPKMNGEHLDCRKAGALLCATPEDREFVVGYVPHLNGRTGKPMLFYPAFFTESPAIKNAIDVLGCAIFAVR